MFFSLSFARRLGLFARASFRLQAITLIVRERLLGRTATLDHPLKICSQSTRLRSELAQLCTDFFLWRQKFHPLSYSIKSFGR